VPAENLTAILAHRVMGWRTGVDRFLMPGRGWTPAWKFQPTKRLSDAFRLLEAVGPSASSITREGGCFVVRVELGGTIGEARDRSKARAITYAIARAIGVDPASSLPAKTGADWR